jgi:hypothetical protein
MDELRASEANRARDDVLEAKEQRRIVVSLMFESDDGHGNRVNRARGDSQIVCDDPHQLCAP